MPVGGCSPKYLTSTFQNCQGHQKQEKPEKLSRIGDMMWHEETKLLNVMWYLYEILKQKKDTR